MKKVLFAFALSCFLAPALVFAKIGVGVGTGKIQVDDKLKPGVIYQLPSLTVVNTGDEASDYEVVISYHEKQEQHAPPQDWFTFTPQKFRLEPGKVQEVNIKLNLPLRIEPGDYFAYLEAHPANTVQEGGTTVGIAAAAKLYFTVVPGSFFEGIYYRILSFWKVYAPWPQRVLATLLIIAALGLFKKYFNIDINLKKSVPK